MMVQKNLDTTGWYEQFYVRKICMTLIDILTLAGGAPFTSAIKEAFKLIRENPIVDVTSKAILTGYFYENISCELKPKKPNYSLGVRPMTMRESIEISQDIVSDKKTYLRHWWNQQKKFAEPIRYPEKDWFDEPVESFLISNRKTANAICINLKLPDNILIEHFKQYLATQRAKLKNNQAEKRYRQPDFNDWIKFSILPYLDLKIWGLEEKLKIPNRVMADAIYPKGEGGEETVRKTTAPLADSLINDEQLSILGAQAALEISERNLLY